MKEKYKIFNVYGGLNIYFSIRWHNRVYLMGDKNAKPEDINMLKV